MFDAGNMGIGEAEPVQIGCGNLFALAVEGRAERCEPGQIAEQASKVAQAGEGWHFKAQFLHLHIGERGVKVLTVIIVRIV
ncbi:MAG TPA: hypothetical protein DCW74_17785 [Alteromonas australica]|uniref:Uncharacterized protein n=1 Tax=Alteromonas australica TaxID=589873 RepID=A0A350P8F3_9ALTE|nr:hypothetical protein [Alteromonas australica]